MQHLGNTRRGTFVALITASLLLSSPLRGADTTITFGLNDGAPGSTTGGSPTITVPPSQGAQAPRPEVTSASAVLMDAATGQVLFAKNEHKKLPNASTTKIMTAILIIEHCKLTDTIRASKNASETPYTSLHLKPGEKMSVKDLLTGMLIRSANDAAVAAAEHIARSVPKFAAMMNAKAREIGCRDTHFVTPNGLYDKNHYSSAYDLCLMARYALRYPVFDEAVNTRRYYLNSRTINKDDLAVFQRSKFLRDYPGADGVKSGYIKQAGHCYVGSATRDGWRLVSAVLKSGNTTSDTAALMDYGFANFQPVTVARANEACAKAEVKDGAAPVVAVAPAADLKVVVPKTGAKVTTEVSIRPVVAPVLKGAKVGVMIASVNGVRAASVDLHATENIEISFARKAWSWSRTCGIVLAACLLVGGRYGTAIAKNTRRRRRRVTATLRGLNRYR